MLFIISVVLMEERYKVCPKCGSKAISQVLGTITGQLYRCPECGYYGPFVIEANEEIIREIREKYQD